jgi:hypothetical protein
MHVELDKKGGGIATLFEDPIELSNGQSVTPTANSGSVLIVPPNFVFRLINVGE